PEHRPKTRRGLPGWLDAIPDDYAQNRERPRGEPGPLDERGGAGIRPYRIGYGLLHHLAVEREVEPLALDLHGYAQPHDEVEHLEDDVGRHRVVDEDDQDAFDLVDHLGRVAFDQAGGAAVLLDGGHAGRQRPA